MFFFGILRVFFCFFVISGNFLELFDCFKDMFYCSLNKNGDFIDSRFLFMEMSLF